MTSRNNSFFEEAAPLAVRTPRARASAKRCTRESRKALEPSSPTLVSAADADTLALLAEHVWTCYANSFAALLALRF